MGMVAPLGVGEQSRTAGMRDLHPAALLTTILEKAGCAITAPRLFFYLIFHIKQYCAFLSLFYNDPRSVFGFLKGRTV